MALLRDTPLRLWEPRELRFGKVFPFAMSQLYEVRTVEGYASLRPYSLSVLSTNEQLRFKPQLADWIYKSDDRDSSSGGLTTNATPGLARFQWIDSPPRQFKVDQLGLNAVRISFGPGPAGLLLWTDSFYPGWQAWVDGTKAKLIRAEPCFSKIEVPASAKVLTLKYRPRFLGVAETLAGFGLFSITLLATIPLRRKSEEKGSA